MHSYGNNRAHSQNIGKENVDIERSMKYGLEQNEMELLTNVFKTIDHINRRGIPIYTKY